MAHKHLMLGSNDKDVEGLLWFPLDPAFDLHLLQSLPSSLCSKKTKSKSKCSDLELTRTWRWPWRHHSTISNSRSPWVYNTIFSSCWPVLAKEWGQEGKKTQMQQSIATECETTPQKNCTYHWVLSSTSLLKALPDSAWHLELVSHKPGTDNDSKAVKCHHI